MSGKKQTRRQAIKHEQAVKIQWYKSKPNKEEVV